MEKYLKKLLRRLGVRDSMSILIMDMKTQIMTNLVSSPQRYIRSMKMTLTLLEAASETHPKWQGGALKAPPLYKKQFRGHFDPIFSHDLDLGKKITLEIF